MTRAGSDDFVRVVFDASYRRLVGQLYAVCGDLTEAEEVVAEAFARAVQYRRSFEDADKPEAWLRTVAVNIGRSRHRRRALAARLLPLAAAPQSRRHPDLSADRMVVVEGLRRLSAGQREALALHYLADLSVQEGSGHDGRPGGHRQSPPEPGSACPGGPAGRSKYGGPTWLTQIWTL